MVVGVCEIDIADLKTARGEKGRAVRGVHWHGDELWSWSTGGRAGGGAPDHVDGWDLGGSERPTDVEEHLNTLDLEDKDDGGVALAEADLNTSQSLGANEHGEGEDGDRFETVSAENSPLTTKGK
jgi:translation initiation factor 2D